MSRKASHSILSHTQPLIITHPPCPITDIQQRDHEMEDPTADCAHLDQILFTFSVTLAADAELSAEISGQITQQNYVIRRRYMDFRSYGHQLCAHFGCDSLLLPSIITLISGTICNEPGDEFSLIHISRDLQGFVSGLLLLPPKVLASRPSHEFFGLWSTDMAAADNCAPLSSSMGEAPPRLAQLRQHCRSRSLAHIHVPWVQRASTMLTAPKKGLDLLVPSKSRRNITTKLIGRPTTTTVAALAGRSPLGQGMESRPARKSSLAPLVGVLPSIHTRSGSDGDIELDQLSRTIQRTRAVDIQSADGVFKAENISWPISVAHNNVDIVGNGNGMGEVYDPIELVNHYSRMSVAGQTIVDTTSAYALQLIGDKPPHRNSLQAGRKASDVSSTASTRHEQDDAYTQMLEHFPPSVPPPSHPVDVAPLDDLLYDTSVTDTLYADYSGIDSSMLSHNTTLLSTASDEDQPPALDAADLLDLYAPLKKREPGTTIEEILTPLPVHESNLDHWPELEHLESYAEEIPLRISIVQWRFKKPLQLFVPYDLDFVTLYEVIEFELRKRSDVDMDTNSGHMWFWTAPLDGSVGRRIIGERSLREAIDVCDGELRLRCEIKFDQPPTLVQKRRTLVMAPAPHRPSWRNSSRARSNTNNSGNERDTAAHLLPPSVTSCQQDLNAPPKSIEKLGSLGVHPTSSVSTQQRSQSKTASGPLNNMDANAPGTYFPQPIKVVKRKETTAPKRLELNLPSLSLDMDNCGGMLGAFEQPKLRRPSEGFSAHRRKRLVSQTSSPATESFAEADTSQQLSLPDPDASFAASDRSLILADETEEQQNPVLRLRVKKNIAYASLREAIKRTLASQQISEAMLAGKTIVVRDINGNDIPLTDDAAVAAAFQRSNGKITLACV